MAVLNDKRSSIQRSKEMADEAPSGSREPHEGHLVKAGLLSPIVWLCGGTALWWPWTCTLCLLPQLSQVAICLQQMCNQASGPPGGPAHMIMVATILCACLVPWTPSARYVFLNQCSRWGVLNGPSPSITDRCPTPQCLG